MFPENRLMVIGPKDLPMVMRKVGQFVGKMRGMAAEFRASFDELARQSELDELRKEVEALRRGAPADAFSAIAGDHVTATFNDINESLAVQMTPLANGPPPPVDGGEAASAVAPAAETTLPASAAAPKRKRAPRKPRTPVSDAP
jgi:sec-independent protein translocase protein TatB